jgi:hypothetical protein
MPDSVGLFCEPTGHIAVNDGLCRSALKAVKLNPILTRIALIWTEISSAAAPSGPNGLPTFIVHKEISILTLLYIKLKPIYFIFLKKIYIYMFNASQLDI